MFAGIQNSFISKIIQLCPSGLYWEPHTSCRKNPCQCYAWDPPPHSELLHTCHHTSLLEELKLRIGECDRYGKRKKRKKNVFVLFLSTFALVFPWPYEM